MKYEILVNSDFCSTEIFTINGKPASHRDFGYREDIRPCEAETRGGCGYMLFSIRESSPDVLKEYGITESEYYKIADILQKEISFGHCNLCAFDY